MTPVRHFMVSPESPTPESARAFEEFRAQVLRDLPLLERLSEAGSIDAFRTLAVREGAARGWFFCEQDVQDAFGAARRAWIERWLP